MGHEEQGMTMVEVEIYFEEGRGRECRKITSDRNLLPYLILPNSMGFWEVRHELGQCSVKGMFSSPGKAEEAVRAWDRSAPMTQGAKNEKLAAAREQRKNATAVSAQAIG
jgi:hypothetical protein